MHSALSPCFVNLLSPPRADTLPPEWPSDFPGGAALCSPCGHTGFCFSMLIKVPLGLLSYEESSCTETGLGSWDTDTVCSGLSRTARTLEWPRTLCRVAGVSSIAPHPTLLCPHPSPPPPLLEGPDLQSAILSETSMWPPGQAQGSLLAQQQNLNQQGTCALCALICPCSCHPSWPSGAELAVAITFAGDN